MLGDDRIVLGALHAGGRRRFRIGAAKLRMVCGAMIAFAVVFPDELPVALLDDGAFEGDLGVLQIVRGQIGRDHVAHGLEVHRLFGKADEDVAADGFAMDRLQAVLVLVEILAHLAGKQQLAVQLVGPLVIGTDKLGGGALGAGTTREPRWRQELCSARTVPVRSRTITTGYSPTCTVK